MAKFALVACVFALLVLCSAGVVAQQQKPASPATATKTVNWGAVSAIGSALSILISLSILFYGFGVKFGRLEERISRFGDRLEELEWFYHFLIETVVADFLQRAKGSASNPGKENPTNPDVEQ